MAGRIPVFQRETLKWTELTPYFFLVVSSTGGRPKLLNQRLQGHSWITTLHPRLQRLNRRASNSILPVHAESMHELFMWCMAIWDERVQVEGFKDDPPQPMAVPVMNVCAIGAHRDVCAGHAWFVRRP